MQLCTNRSVYVIIKSQYRNPKHQIGFWDFFIYKLNQYFKQPSFQFNILWRISLAVKHNFLMELGEQLGIAYETKAEKALKAQLLEKEEYIKELESQLKVYRGIHKVTE